MNITYKITNVDTESKSLTVVFTHNNVELPATNLPLGSMKFNSLAELHSEIGKMGMYMFQSQPNNNDVTIANSLELNTTVSIDVSEYKPVPIDQIKIKIREVLLAEGLIK